MSTAALQRTVRRCTALLVLLLGLGFDSAANGFDGTPLAVGAIAYLVVSGFLGLLGRYNEHEDLADPAPVEHDSDDGGDSVA